jgi:hypothetical protein
MHLYIVHIVTTQRGCHTLKLPPTYFGLSRGYPRGVELQRMDTSRYYKISIILRAFVVSLQYPAAHCKVMEHLKLIMKCLISL